MAAVTFSVANSAQISSRDFMVRHHKQDQPVGDRRSTPEETNQFFHDLGAEIGDVGRVLAGGVDHLVASATNRAASEQQVWSIFCKIRIQTRSEGQGFVSISLRQKKCIIIQTFYQPQGWSTCAAGTGGGEEGEDF